MGLFSVGYYVHHQGSGHTHRALSISQALPADVTVTGLSTAPKPTGWPAEWVQLADDAGALPTQGLTAGGRLHYVPLGHDGLRTRMAQIADWIDQHQPDLMIVDVSVEVALLARLHGVRVVSVAMPGQRDDPAHRLGYDVSDHLLAPWPTAVGPLWPATAEDRAKTTFVGAISRFAPLSRPVQTFRRVVVLNGNGGAGPSPTAIADAAAATPDWEWVHLDRAHGRWVEDPWPLLCSAGVVVSHAGQNAIAEIAAARRPAVVIPQERPFREQRVMADALAGRARMPVVVRPGWPAPQDWPALLAQTEALDGTRWRAWNDGHGAERAVALLLDLLPERTAAVSA